MSRKPKIHYSKSFHHVMLRGNYKQKIFLDEADYNHFYKLLEKVTKQYGCKIHLFCLMTNHAHLVIEIEHATIGKVVQSVSSPYARYFNKKYQVSGHLFQGRYLGKLIQDEKYLLELCYYIHMNPIKAKMVKQLDDYPWSSHFAYSGSEKLSWLTTRYINQLLKNQVDSENFYADFMNDRQNNYREPVFCSIDDDGCITIQDSVNAKLNNYDRLDLRSLSVMKIMEEICEKMSVSLDRVISGSREQDCVLARCMIVYFAHYYGRYRLNYIAVHLDRGPAGLSKTLHNLLAHETKGKIAAYWIKLLRALFEEVVNGVG